MPNYKNKFMNIDSPEEETWEDLEGVEETKIGQNMPNSLVLVY